MSDSSREERSRPRLLGGWLSPRRPWLYVIATIVLLAAGTPALAKVAGMSVVLSLKTLAGTMGIIAVLLAWILSGPAGNVGRTPLIEELSSVQVVERNEPAPPVWEILLLLGYAAILFAVVLLLPG